MFQTSQTTVVAQLVQWHGHGCHGSGGSSCPFLWSVAKESHQNSPNRKTVAVGKGSSATASCRLWGVARTVTGESACQSSWPPHALQEIGLVPVVVQAYCDAKASAQTFLLHNGCPHSHIFPTVEDMISSFIDGEPIRCLRHRACTVTSPQFKPNAGDDGDDDDNDDEASTFVCAGFPCAPFSIQRTGRHCLGRCFAEDNRLSYSVLPSS